jgi:putative PIN family toxin of toxin-antitoxin system
VRAVLDTNVLVAALLSRHGRPAGVVSRWLAGEFELIVSPLLLAELERVLAYPKIADRIAAADADAFVQLLADAAVVAPDPAATPARSADADDDYLLALAESMGAVVVTGDRHLLELAGRIPVDTVARFVERLDEPSP